MIENLPEILSSILGDLFNNTRSNDYFIGVFLAIISGILNSVGLILQKQAINEIPAEAKLMRSLVKMPRWVMGFIIYMVIATVTYMLAQAYIGPTLIPGLMASGLIVLAIGSVKIVKEELNPSEIFGIFLLIGAIAFIGFSSMEINITLINFLDIELIIRITIFTISIVILSLTCEILQIKNIQKGISFAIFSGLMYGLSNFWISPLLATIVHVLNGTFQFMELIIFIFACVILILANIFALTELQRSLRVAQASNMIPIQQIPVQVIPPFYFLVVYLLPLPTIFSIVFLLAGIAMIIVSIFLLGKRQAELEKIK